MKFINQFFIIMIYSRQIFIHTQSVMDRAQKTIGCQIRELRKARGLTVTELANAINRSVGYVSQAERDKSEVTIATLGLIAETLRVDLSWFFDQQQQTENAEHSYVVRARARRRLNFIGAGMTESLLSPSLGGESLMILNESQPGAVSGGLIERDVELSGYVLSGKLELILKEESIMLDQGDSFVLPRKMAHDFKNIGNVPCRVIWYLTPAIY